MWNVFCSVANFVLQLNVRLISMHSKWVLFKSSHCPVLAPILRTVRIPYCQYIDLFMCLQHLFHILYCTCYLIVHYCITCTVKAMYCNHTALTLQCTVPLLYCQNIVLYSVSEITVSIMYYRFTVNILYFPVLYCQYLVLNLYSIVNIVYHAVYILKYTCTMLYCTCTILSISCSVHLLYCQHLVVNL